MYNYGLWGYETFLTVILSIVAVIIVLWAQVNINFTYGKYKQKSNKKGLSGQETARKILDANGLSDIYIVETNGNLSDHYDPNRKVVRLSKDIFHGTSIAAISVAAHECGHAIQDKDNYVFMKIRSMLVPIVNIVSYLGYFGLIVSILAGITGYLKLSILVLFATLVFQLVTLPVEFDASKRAGIELEKLDIVEASEKKHCMKMLKAAALTYVASLISTLLNLLRIVLMLASRKDD